MSSPPAQQHRQQQRKTEGVLSVGKRSPAKGSKATRKSSAQNQNAQNQNAQNQNAKPNKSKKGSAPRVVADASRELLKGGAKSTDPSYSSSSYSSRSALNGNADSYDEYQYNDPWQQAKPLVDVQNRVALIEIEEKSSKAGNRRLPKFVNRVQLNAPMTNNRTNDVTQTSSSNDILIRGSAKDSGTGNSIECDLIIDKNRNISLKHSIKVRNQKQSAEDFVYNHSTPVVYNLFHAMFGALIGAVGYVGAPFDQLVAEAADDLQRGAEDWSVKKVSNQEPTSEGGGTLIGVLIALLDVMYDAMSHYSENSIENSFNTAFDDEI